MKHRALCWFVGLAIALGAAHAGAAGDPRELKAREDFAAGRYQEALDVFAKLYAETLHPVYLRNIGRCYQNLGDADKAIISFRDYLRKHKTISADERAEVEGFIKEMEALKKEKAAETPPPETSSPPKSSITTLPTAPEPKNSAGAKPEVLVTAPGGGAREESSPVYTTWWFWTLVGAALVGAGVGVAAATGVFTKTKDAPCMAPYNCPPS